VRADAITLRGDRAEQRGDRQENEGKSIQFHIFIVSTGMIFIV
jgi:hypothetical protein